MLHNAIEPNILIELKILLVIAFCLLFSPYIARFLRLPLSATEIILGLLAGFLGLIGDSVNFKFIADIGFYYLMFIAGMEVNLKKFFYMKNFFLKKIFLYIILLYSFSFLLVLVFDLSYIYIIILPIMSVGLLATLYKDFGKECIWLNISMLAATLAEVVSICLLTIMATFLSDNNILKISTNIIYLAIFLLLCLFSFKLLKLIFWWYPNLKTIIMPSQDKNERDIRFCMGMLIFIVCIMIISGLEIVLGAFILGSFISTFFEYKKDLEYKLSSFGFGFLIPIFFIYIGSTLKLDLILDVKILKYAIFLIISMFFIRFICSLVFINKFGFKKILLFSLSHSMPLTLLIAAASLFYNAHIIEQTIYFALILTALFESILMISLIRFISFRNNL